MLFRRAMLDRIARGEVTLAFRRWKRPTVKAGGRLRTPTGVLHIGAVTQLRPDDVTGQDARAAGYADGDAAVLDLGKGEGSVYRIEIGPLEADGRDALRRITDISETEWNELRARFDRWERTAPDYHRSLLGLIGRSPATAAGLLADELGVDKAKLKRDIRALKELGLTESLDTGYRLSPRGVMVLENLGAP